MSDNALNEFDLLCRVAARQETHKNEILYQISQLRTKMAALDDKITALTAEVANNTSVESSALTLISGLATQLAAALAAAAAAGATPAQLASLQSVADTLTANDTALAAAVAANTAPATTTATPASTK